MPNLPAHTTQSIDTSITTSPVAIQPTLHWIKRPADAFDAETKLRQQDEWFRKNQATVMENARTNTIRLTGKHVL